MEESLITADALGFSYQKPVLSDFGLRVGAGEIVLLIGLNGAGKSTALGVLAGEKLPEIGRVRIKGKDPRRARTRRHLFFLKEQSALHPHLTARETVGFYLGLYARSGRGRAVTSEVLERTGLGHVATRRSATFSKGMRRRLELASLLAVDPEVWLLDEPQTGLDPQGLRLLRVICQEARTRGRGLVIASHALADIPALADQVVLLRQGKTVFSGGREELIGRVGAASWTIKGGDPGLAEALVALAKKHGGEASGPEVPAPELEDLLFDEGASR